MNNELKQKQTAILVGRAWSGFSLAVFVSFFVSMFTLLMVLVNFVGLSDAQQMVLQTVLFHWCGLFFIVGHARWLKTSCTVLYGLCGGRFLRFRQTLTRYVGMMAVVIVGSLMWRPLLQFFGVELEPQDVVGLILNAEPVALRLYLVFLAVVLAPVFEELLFRGILFPVLAKRMSVKMAAIFVSIFFALVHGHLPAFLPLMLVSLCLCRAYWRTGSLWVNIGMHMLFNGVNLTLMYHFGQ